MKIAFAVKEKLKIQILPFILQTLSVLLLCKLTLSIFVLYVSYVFTEGIHLFVLNTISSPLEIRVNWSILILAMLLKMSTMEEI